ncbi:MAG: radical SAM protein [Nocardioides sp.]
MTERARLGWFFARLAAKEHLKPDLHVRPLVAELFLTDNCNLRCVTCNCWRENTKGELSTDEWKQVLDQLAKLRIHKANFTGGEPLIRPDAIELIEYASAAGVRHLHLNTNALKLTPSIADRVIAGGVRSFNISVDGPTALVHDRVRGRLGSFHTTMDHLRALVDRRAADGLKIRMNFTIMRDNVEYLPDIARLAQRLSVRLYLNLATDTTFLFRADEVSDLTEVDAEKLDIALAELEEIRRSDAAWLPSYPELNYIRGHFDELLQRDLPCAESQLKLMIHSRGEIGGCWAHDPRFNVRDTTVREVIDSPEYRAEHERFFRKQCVGCGSNYSLNLRWRPASRWQELMWRRGRRTLARQ